jgi:hypothetical protein
MARTHRSTTVVRVEKAPPAVQFGFTVRGSDHPSGERL